MQIEWVLFRKHHGIDRKTKIFICRGYASFKKALLERGWIENPDINSPVFHLKFTVKRDHILKHNGQPKHSPYNQFTTEIAPSVSHQFISPN